MRIAHTRNNNVNKSYKRNKYNKNPTHNTFKPWQADLMTKKPYRCLYQNLRQ